MGIRNLDRLFSPASVAVAGGSDRPGSAGRALVANLIAGGFAGRIDVVNPRLRSLGGIDASARLSDLAHRPDLLVVTAPPRVVPGLVAEAVALGVPAVLVASAGIDRAGLAAMADALRGSGTRLIGPNSVGVAAPHAGLNASFAARRPAAGDIAVIAQSGAVMAGLVEWSARAGAGFSALVATGDRFDVDTADMLDYFALDRATRAIVLYVETLHHTQKFMSAARAAARAKPVFVLKAGRFAAAEPHALLPARLADADGVFDAAFRRAGLIRINDFDDLLALLRTLSRVRPFSGETLAILSNGRATGLLAADAVLARGGRLARLSPQTLAAFAATKIAGDNPADLRGDADGRRYSAAVDCLLADDAVDAVLAVHTPGAFTDSVDVAQALAGVVEQHRALAPQAAKPVFAAWLGGAGPAHDALEAAQVPVFETEREAARGFTDMVRSATARRALMDTPPTMPREFSPDGTRARGIVAAALGQGRKALDAEEAAALLRAYDIEVRPAQAESSPRLFAGIADDQTFGPVVVFGRGGAGAVVDPDRSIALPPLDLRRADDMIGDTRIAALIGLDPAGASHRAGLALTLVKLAQLAVDLPELRQLELHPLLCAPDGIVARAAEVRLAPLAVARRGRGNPRLSVRGYPAEWERSFTLNDGRRIFVRPVKPEDEPLFEAFFPQVTAEDLRLRFFSPVRHFSHAFIARLTQLDYARAMALAAIDAETGELLGAVRLHGDAENEEGEYAILLRSDLKGRGLGWMLMQLIIEYARAEGYRIIEGQVLRENTTMLAMCEKLGFASHADPDDPEIRVVRLPIAVAQEIASRGVSGEPA